MSIWSDNPEWFDEWLERQAADGRFDDTPHGPEIKRLIEEGDFCGWQWWDRLDTDGKLGSEACTAFFERWVP